jgi:hypothetical protein
LEKIVDGNPVCVAKDGEYTCASGQVLKEVKNGAAVCVDRDAQYDCGPNQVLKNVNNGSATCVDMDKAYTCTVNQVLQATSTGGAVCVDKDRGVTGCPWGQFAYGISYGMPLCAQVYNAAPSNGVFGGFYIYRHLQQWGFESDWVGQGGWQWEAPASCLKGNPFTGGCSCPGYAPTAHHLIKYVAETTDYNDYRNNDGGSYSGNVYADIYICM